MLINTALHTVSSKLECELCKKFIEMRANLFFLATLFLILLTGSVESANIFVSSNTTWSSIASGSGPGGQPDNTDDIFVYGGATLTLDVVGATINSVNLGSN